MGTDLVAANSPTAFRKFTRALLRDLTALNRMLDEGLIETGITRIGAEQEMFLVDEAWRPAPASLRLLEDLDPRYFTTELALFNLEANLSPRVLQGRCFSEMHEELDKRVEEAERAARANRARVVLTGILPTLAKSDLDLSNITPRERYFALNESLKQAGGGSFRLKIRGTDELRITHDSVMLEACNTSCQVHLQVAAEAFAHTYNVAQVVTGPVLAGAVNSPLLFGRRLWSETRIALFQQSLDTRGADLHMREMSPRVRFGGSWVRESVAELFQEDIAAFRVLLAQEIEEDPLEALSRGEVPKLDALQLHNSTVYRWNRPCYGMSQGKPHLRIECRALPSGPTTIDEMANTVLWIGAVLGCAARYPDITERIDFDDTKTNFLSASRQGLRAVLVWLDGEAKPADRVILEEIIPLAREGLALHPISSEDVDRYLGVVQERVEKGVTGSAWQLRSLSALRKAGTRGEAMAAITAAMHRQRALGLPVAQWESPDLSEAGGWRHHYTRVEQFMSTSLTTVAADEPVELVAYLMNLHDIRHVLIETKEHRLVGIVSYRSVLRIIAQGRSLHEMELTPVSEVMTTDPVTVAPETPTLRAIEMMRKHKVSALPVISGEQLVGIVTETDFMPIAYQLLEELLHAE